MIDDSMFLAFLDEWTLTWRTFLWQTVNDVAVGTVSYAIHLYNQRMGQDPSGTRMTALVLLNTRMTSEYQSVSDMLRAKTWGNHFTFLHIPIPCCNHAERADPLAFIHKAKKTIKRKKNSLVYFSRHWGASEVLRWVAGLLILYSLSLVGWGISRMEWNGMIL